MTDPQLHFDSPELQRFGHDLYTRASELDQSQRGPVTPLWRWSLAGLALLTILGSAVTPPGRALAERVGELVGIGSPSTVREPDLRDPRLGDQQTRLGPALVANTGTLPSGERFEIVAWAARTKHVVGVAPDGSPETAGAGALMSCLGVVYPDVGSQETGKFCSWEPLGTPVHIFNTGPPLLGVTEPTVRRVRVTYLDRDGSRMGAPVTLGRLTAALMRETGAPEQFGMFVAAVPPAQAETTEVTAFDSRGHVLIHRTSTSDDAE